MKLRLVDDWASLRGRSDEWNALLDGSSAEEKFLTFEWADALRQTRSPDRAMPALVGEDGNRLAVVWPLLFAKRRLGRVLPCRVVGDVSQWFAPHHGVVCGQNRLQAVRECLSFLCEKIPRWDVLEIVGLVENSETHRAIETACHGLELAFQSQAGSTSPYLPLDGSWEAYVADCSSKFRSDLKRCERSVSQLGKVACRCCDVPSELPSAYESVMEIERQSWKHTKGSAISSRPWEDRFYRELLDRAGPRGWLQVTLLTVDGRPIAHDLGMVYQNRYACLKTSFVEEVRSANPGKVIRRHIIESLYARGIQEHDFLGEAEPWKMQWTRLVRPHVNLTIYRRRGYAILVSGLRGLKRLGRSRAPEAGSAARSS